MPPMTIIAIALITCLMLGGGLLAMLIIHNKLSALEHREKESGKKLEEEMTCHYKLNAGSESVSTEAPSTPAAPDVAKEGSGQEPGNLLQEPDAFADTRHMQARDEDALSDDSPDERPSRIPPEGIILPDHDASTPLPSQQKSESVHAALSEIPEINRKARSGDPVASAIWKIHEAGQMETLEEAIPLGRDFSPARAVRLTNGKRLIAVPPNHPPESIQLLLRDCDALIVFPDAQTPLVATELGKQLVENIFNASQTP